MCYSTGHNGWIDARPALKGTYTASPTPCLPAHGHSTTAGITQTTVNRLARRGERLLVMSKAGPCVVIITLPPCHHGIQSDKCGLHQFGRLVHVVTSVRTIGLARRFGVCCPFLNCPGYVVVIVWANIEAL